MRRGSGGAGGDEGFTLVELMIVILIIGVLIGIGLPTFLGARERSQDRAAQSLLRNALTAAKVYYTDHMAYDNFENAAQQIEPSISFAVWPDTGVGVVTLKFSDPTLYFTSESASGQVFCLAEGPTGTSYARLDVAVGTPCHAGAITYYPTPQQGWAPP